MRASSFHRLAALLPLVSLLSVGIAAIPSATAPTAYAAPTEITKTQAGPLGGVSVIGDSVLLGSALYSPTLPDQLVSRGWGPIRFRAGEGYSTGRFPVSQLARASYWIGLWKTQGWDPPNVIVNLGANDSGFCSADLACARASILFLVDVIGPGHRIWWPQVTKLIADDVNPWNLALRQIADERPDFFTWDWPTVMVAEKFVSPDAIHLSPDSYRRRSARMADEFTLAVASATRSGGDAALPAAEPGASTYVPMTPERVLDTRTHAPGRLAAGSTLTVDFGDRLPDGATAVAVNVTAAQPGDAGYLTASRCGASPLASTVNFTAGRSRGAMTIVPIGADHRLCIYTRVASDVVVDLQGAFVAGDAAAGLEPLAIPRRLADTRSTGRTKVLVVQAPVGSSAVAVNLTAVNANTPGFLRAYPCGGTVPPVSNLNFGPGEAIAGAAYVPTSDAGTICVSSNVSVDVVVDLTGTFATGAGLHFKPVTPTRMLDTRRGIGGWSPIHGSTQTLDVGVAPSGARAVTGTLTMVRPFARGYLTAFPATFECVGVPTTSSVNTTAGAVLANSVTAGTSASGRLCIFSSRATHTVFDTTGWWVP